MNEIKTYEVKDVDGNTQTFYTGEIILVSDDNEYWTMCLLGNISDGIIYATSEGDLDLDDLFDYNYIKKLHPTIPERWIIDGVVYTNGEEVLVSDGEDKWENGMIKEIPDFTVDNVQPDGYGSNPVRVVYNCAGQWDNFKNYTSALTNLEDLKLGWKS